MNEQVLKSWQKALSSKQYKNIMGLSEKGFYFGNSINFVFTDFKTGSQDTSMAKILDNRLYLNETSKTKVELDVNKVYQCPKGIFIHRYSAVYSLFPSEQEAKLLFYAKNINVDSVLKVW